MTDAPGPKQKTAMEIPASARLHIWQIQAVRDILWVAAVIGLVWVGYVIRTVTVPLLVAMLLAYLFEPLVSKLSKYPRMSRPKVVGGLLFFLVAGLILVLALGVPLVVDQSVRLVRDVQRGQLASGLTQVGTWLPDDYQPRYVETLQSLEDTLGVDLIKASGGAGGAQTMPAATMATAESPTTSGGNSQQGVGGGSIFQIVQTTSRAVFDAIGQLLTISFMLFLIPFYFYFFSVGFPDAVAFGQQLIPVKNRDAVLQLFAKMDRAVAGFVRGRIIICIIIGVLLAIGWAGVGVPKGIVIGLVTGLLSLVPYLGGLGIPVAVAMMAFAKMSGTEGMEYSWAWVILAPVGVFAIVQLIENYILIPFIAGKATNLGPVSILVAVLAGGSLMGVYGMILSIPVAACLKILIIDVLFPRVRKWMRGEAPDPLPWG